jgi:hypothetical protein
VTGAIDIFNNLPVEWIGVKELQEIAEGKGTEPSEIFCWFYLSSLKYNAAFMMSAPYKSDKVYSVAVNVHDYLVHRDTGVFESHKDYLANPQQYKAKFHEKVCFSLVDCYSFHTRKLNRCHGHLLYRYRLPPSRPWSSTAPIGTKSSYYRSAARDPARPRQTISDAEHCCDILPMELPHEASEHFNQSLYRHLEQMVNLD